MARPRRLAVTLAALAAAVVAVVLVRQRRLDAALEDFERRYGPA